MPSGTTIKIFAPRIHKSNARTTAEDAKATMQHIRNKVTALAVATPKPDIESLEEIMDLVSEVFHEYEMMCFNWWCANEIIDNPDECEDELDDGSNRFSSVEELSKDLAGTLCDKKCPRCGSQLLTNSSAEFWCSHVDCDYGLED